MKFLFPGAVLLLLLTACDRMLTPPAHDVYGAWEEGLTLGFEDPSLPPGPRFQNRQQVRVKEAKPDPAGLAVTLTYASLTGQFDAHFVQKDGGVVLRMDNSTGIQVLPAGFPDRVGRWEDRGVAHWVVGRQLVSLPGVTLPDPDGAVGVWVESSRLDGAGTRLRTLYLPNIGEAETLEWRKGAWVATNRLVTRGFTDAPRPAQVPKSGSPS